MIYAATLLIDLTALRRLVSFRRGELVIAASAFLGVLVLGILYGVLVAIGVSVAELLVRVARPHDAILGIVPGIAGMHDIDDYPQAQTIPGLVVYRYDAPLFFANAQDFRRRALAAARSGGPGGPARWFVLNVEANVEVDFTALEALDQLRDELARGRDHPGARPCQAGPAGPSEGVRPRQGHRARPVVPHPAVRGRRLPALDRGHPPEASPDGNAPGPACSGDG